jgi:hypothetical protein
MTVACHCGCEKSYWLVVILPSFYYNKNINSCVEKFIKMSHKKRKRRAYVAWVIISVLAVISMIAFLFAPLIRS